MAYLEPIYVNEAMVLNAAAYLFKGFSTETEERTGRSTGQTLNVHAGLNFLQGLIGRAGIGADANRATAMETSTVRRYTLGGLHMTVLDELLSRGMLHDIDPANRYSGESEGYVNLKVALQPVDFYQILVTARTLVPLAARVLKMYAPRKFSDSSERRSKGAKGTDNRSTKAGGNSLLQLADLEEQISEIIEGLERDYLSANQIELVMHDPESKERVGIVDVDVRDLDQMEVKARLTDGTFTVIGKITKRIEEGEQLSLVQRTVLPYALGVFDSVMELSEDVESIRQYQASMALMRGMIERILPLSIGGPAVRVAAMSVCA